MRFKWEPAAAMAGLLLLGFWVVYAPTTPHELRTGAMTQKFSIASQRGELEIVRDEVGAHAESEFTFRLLWRDGSASEVMSADEFTHVFGQERYESAVANAGNKLFRALNITSWGSLAWVGLGFAGQVVFSGRFLVQWVVSEKKRQSVIPVQFWWMSLVGGVLLFAYFAWRQDVVGVMGQTSGLVIYARNIRLVWKQKKRALRAQTDDPASRERSDDSPLKESGKPEAAA